jgi:hypothetical protein
MRLISLAISLLLITVTLSYCLKGGSKIAQKQAQVKCSAEGLDKTSEAYKNCVKEDAAKPMHIRAQEIKKEAKDTRNMINSINKDMKDMLKKQQ